MQNRNTEEKTGSESDDASDEESLSESPLEDSEAASVFSKACPAKSGRFNGLLACMSKNSSWISHSSQNVNPLDLYSTRLMWLPLVARHTHTHTTASLLMHGHVPRAFAATTLGDPGKHVNKLLDHPGLHLMFRT